MIRVLTACITVLSLAACAEGEILGLPADELEQRLVAGDFSFLEGLEEPEVSRRAYRNLESGTGYYLARVLLEHDRAAEAITILGYEAEYGDEPWRRNAAVLLLEQLAESRRHDELVERAPELLEEYPDEPMLYHSYGDALYRLERDRELGNLLSELAGREDAVGNAFTRPTGRFSAEAGLWRAVLAYRNDLPDWADRFDELFGRFEPSDAHSRVYLYTISRSELHEQLSGAQRALYEGKHHLNEWRYGEAWSAFRTALGNGAQELLTERLLHDIARAAEAAGAWSEAAARYEELLDDLPDDRQSSDALEAVVLERLGRLYRVGNAGDQAVDRLRQAHELQPDNERILWYLLSASSRNDHRQFVRDLRGFAPLIRTPSYFDDLFEETGVRMVAAGDWQELFDIYQLLEEHGTERLRARYAFILATAIEEHGFLPDEYRGRDPGVVQQELLGVAANQNSSPYYALMARVALGRDLELYSDNGVGRGVGGAGADSAAAAPDAEASARRVAHPLSSYEIEHLVAGYFRYGLYDHGYRTALRYSSLMSSSGLIAASHALREQEKNIESLRLLGRARRHSDFVLDREHAELLYPVLYPDEFETVIESERLDWSVFYALVREESHFASDVVSHAGAIGLSQLMPGTAADIAARMGLSNPDLTDPETNLRIGAFYLRGLLDRFPTPMHALAAYNGGQGRVRSWQRMRPNHGDLLFHEAIPFYETREYVRKIVVSAVYYGKLYEDREADEVVAAVFPGFQRLR